MATQSDLLEWKARYLWDSYCNGNKETEKARKRLAALEENLGPEVVAKMNQEAKLAGGEQYRPKSGATACEPFESKTPTIIHTCRFHPVPSKASVLADLRSAEKESPRLRQDVAAGTSPSALVTAALDIENQQ